MSTKQANGAHTVARIRHRKKIIGELSLAKGARISYLPHGRSKTLEGVVKGITDLGEVLLEGTDTFILPGSIRTVEFPGSAA